MVVAGSNMPDLQKMGMLPVMLGESSACMKQITKVERDSTVKDRAKLTAPWPLYIDKTTSSVNYFGVFTGAAIPRGLIFGPCEGVIVPRDSTVTGCAWVLKGHPKTEIDAEDTSLTNFLRYLNVADKVHLNNLGAIQVCDEMFYVTLRDIEKDEELLITGGTDYAISMGVEREYFFNVGDEDNPQFRCPNCPETFQTLKDHGYHMKKCQYSSSAF